MLINFTAHDYILLCSFIYSPCLQYILRNKRLTFWETSFALKFSSLARNDENPIFDLENGGSTYTRVNTVGLSPYITNWYMSFLEGTKQRLLYDGFVGQWKDVNKGTTQGSVSGPHLFTIFLHDLEISLNGKDILFNYADDTSIFSPVWKEQDNSEDIKRTFMEWSEKNFMSSNSKKCKELVIRKKSCTNVFTPVFSIPQTCQLSVLGLILQDDCRFDCHVHVKLIKAN